MEILAHAGRHSCCPEVRFCLSVRTRLRSGFQNEVELDYTGLVLHLSRPANHPGIEPAAVRAEALSFLLRKRAGLTKWVLASLRHALFIR